MRKLAVARLWYEGNSFSPVPTGLPVFEAREFFQGATAKDFYRGTKTEIGSTVDGLHLSAEEPKSLIVLEGGGRPTTWSHFAEYYEAVKQWFDYSLVAVGDRPVK